jgi:hypothetical protein
MPNKRFERDAPPANCTLAVMRLHITIRDVLFVDVENISALIQGEG